MNASRTKHHAAEWLRTGKGAADEKEPKVRVQEAEINRREKELIATYKGAEMEISGSRARRGRQKAALIAEKRRACVATRAQGEAKRRKSFQKENPKPKARNVKHEARHIRNTTRRRDRPLYQACRRSWRAQASRLATRQDHPSLSTGNGDASGMNKITQTSPRWRRRLPR